MDAYLAMGCRPTWTCAPYQLADRPGFGQHVAWGESNAIVFANSVLGARTGRYGDFTDICAALTGRVPHAGLHRDENRRGELVFRLDWLESSREVPDAVFGLIGLVVGEASGSLVPAIVGLPPDTNEDQLKSLGAAAASSGSVAMFHAVGLTPEAPTLDAALGGAPPTNVVDISRQRLREAWRGLSSPGEDDTFSTVSVGTPHFSEAQFAELDRLLAGRAINEKIEMYVSTGRDTLTRLEASGIAGRLAAAGVKVVVDTCTYVTPILRAGRGATVMTDSAKWAWYAPANLDVGVAYGTLADCVESAVAGHMVHGPLPVLDG
jgi:predicted aconitase